MKKKIKKDQESKSTSMFYKIEHTWWRKISSIVSIVTWITLITFFVVLMLKSLCIVNVDVFNMMLCVDMFDNFTKNSFAVNFWGIWEVIMYLSGIVSLYMLSCSKASKIKILKGNPFIGGVVIFIVSVIVITLFTSIITIAVNYFELSIFEFFANTIDAICISRIEFTQFIIIAFGVILISFLIYLFPNRFGNQK